MATEGEAAPLHKAWMQQPRAFINRVFTLLHSCMLFAMFYYRATTAFSPSTSAVLLARAISFMAEAAFAFCWLLSQPFGWRPVTREVFPERLPADESLPNIDVFVCTADPEKEPVVEVMNTVLAAMAMDYPAEKLAVYLSDDGGSPATLNAMREVAAFATAWLPFCKKHGAVARSPEAYFWAPEHGHIRGGHDFIEERQKMEFLYGAFKKRVNAFERGGRASKDRPALVEVISDKTATDQHHHNDKTKIPMLVYVSREKSTLVHHNFKAGALNVLLRVSRVMSNAPYILMLDCDMCSNDPSSARQAMCFHLDPNLSPKLAFVQFPQIFDNLGSKDIYGNGFIFLMKRFWPGMDGLQGPMLDGTGFYIKRSALEGAKPGKAKNDSNIEHIKETSGSSPLLIASDPVNQDDSKANTKDSTIAEAHILASCAYENDTEWGKEIGFLYGSVVEDYFTGYNLHCRGWKSVYLNPSRPAFLGSAPINMRDILVQNKRWASGLFQVALSRFCPLTWGAARTSILQSFCYASLAFWPLQSLLLFYALLHPICLFNRISLYPKVSSPWFFVFLGSYVLYVGMAIGDSLMSGMLFKQWWYEERSWMMKAVSAFFFGSLSVILKFIGIGQVNFELTNKTTAVGMSERYSKGVFDFQDTGLLIIPLITVAITNVVCFAVGVWRMVRERSSDLMMGEFIVSSIILIFTQPILEGILIRNDEGRVPTSPFLFSMIFSAVILCLGSVFFHML